MTTNALVAPKKDGRGLASIYTDELAERIAREHGKGLSFESIGELPWAPGARTLYQWQDEGRGIFAQALARARKAKAWHHAHQPLELLEAADPAALGADGKPADPRIANARITRADKLAGHHRWLAERLDRKQWGDALKMDVSATLQIVAAFADLSRSERDATAELEEPAMPHVVVPDPVTPDPRA